MSAINVKEHVFDDGMPGVPKCVQIVLQDDAGDKIGSARIYAGYLNDLWVRDDCRKQGLGTRLVQTAILRGATKAMAAATEMRVFLTRLGWTSTDGRRFASPAA